jgi:hypothetical protein
MDCPHCGGWVGTGGPKPLAHAVFDDPMRRIVVDGEARRLTPGEWKILTELRQRFRRFVPLDHLAQVSCWDPAEGGNVPAVRIRVCFIRRKLAGTPFAIATGWGTGYGLFPADHVLVESQAGLHEEDRKLYTGTDSGAGRLRGRRRMARRPRLARGHRH